MTTNPKRIVIDLKSIWSKNGERSADVGKMGEYVEEAVSKLREPVNEERGIEIVVVLTGAAPTWLYVAVIAGLIGVARKFRFIDIVYYHPETAEINVFGGE